MIYPPIEELTNNKYNRYMLVIAASKCARMVTDEYCNQRAVVEKLIQNKQTDKTIASQIKSELRDDKAVKTAINRLYKGNYRIVDESLDVEYQAEKLRAEQIEEEKEERALAQRKREEDESRKAQRREYALAHADEKDEDEDYDIPASMLKQMEQQAEKDLAESEYAGDVIPDDGSDEDLNNIGGSAISGIDRSLDDITGDV